MAVGNIEAAAVAQIVIYLDYISFHKCFELSF